MDKTQGFKSYMKYYRAAWLIILIILLVVKFFIFGSASKTQLFVLSVITLLVIWLPLMLVNFIERSRMNKYLYKYLEEEGANSSRDFKGLKGKSQDPVVNEVRGNLKNLRKLIYSVFLSMVLLFAIIMFI